QADPVGLLSADAVTDPDQPANFEFGSLTIAITAGEDSGHDQIVLLVSSPFTAVDISGTTQFRDGGHTVATAPTASVGTSSITLTLSNNATPTEVDKLLEAFGFQSDSTLT